MGNNRKQKKFSILRTKKSWTISERKDNADTGAGIILPSFEQTAARQGVLGLAPTVERHSALLARHEQTIHAGSRPEKKAVAHEIA
jgi:hypothetical protein